MGQVNAEMKKRVVEDAIARFFGDISIPAETALEMMEDVAAELDARIDALRRNLDVD